MQSPIRHDKSQNPDWPAKLPALAARRVLIIDGDLQLADLLRTRLAEAGFSATVLASGENAAAVIDRDDPHLVILDLDLPGAITMVVMRHVTQRAGKDRKPRVMALSAHSGEQRVADGLEQGLDDYVVKPFSLPEVMARVRALLRPVGTTRHDPGVLEFQQLRLDLVEQRATVLGKRVHLRTAEFRLLEFLLRHPERAYGREQLLSEVWGHSCAVDARSVDVTVQRVRHSLEPYGWRGYLQTIRGVGYRLSASRT